METRSIRPVTQPLDVIVRATPSKSVTHRALVVASLAHGTSVLDDPLQADDTQVTRDGLAAMGVVFDAREGSLGVHGTGGALRGGARVELGDSGTSLRLLVAVAALSAQPSRFDGSARLRERPLHGLLVALEALGAQVRFECSTGKLPLWVGGAPLRGGAVRLVASPSSQFASALLLAAPLLPGGLDLVLEPPVVSYPYVELTAAVMGAFGVPVEQPRPLELRVRPGRYSARGFAVEGDHSSASYFLAAAAAVGGRVRVEGLRPTSLQPDARLGRLLRELGCRVDDGPDWIEARGTGEIVPFDVDLRASPDLAPTLAVLALFAPGPCRMRGLAHSRLKESDRLAAMAQSLARLGRQASVVDGALEVGPPAGRLVGAIVDPASDHRLAMAFALAGLRIPGVEVGQPTCVAKSNPAFWSQFAALEGTSRA